MIPLVIVSILEALVGGFVLGMAYTSRNRRIPAGTPIVVCGKKTGHVELRITGYMYTLGAEDAAIVSVALARASAWASRQR
jgi:hypothetical protein